MITAVFVSVFITVYQLLYTVFSCQKFESFCLDLKAFTADICILKMSCFVPEDVKKKNPNFLKLVDRIETKMNEPSMSKVSWIIIMCFSSMYLLITKVPEYFAFLS